MGSGLGPLHNALYAFILAGVPASAITGASTWAPASLCDVVGCDYYLGSPQKSSPCPRRHAMLLPARRNDTNYSQLPRGRR